MGSTTLPIDLLIFSPLLVRKPCAKTRRGSAIPADIRKAGQYTVWNRMMSLPIMWMLAGQYRPNSSESVSG
ncbi:Uncharacterised protein [Mycobacteroides abscessus subsp. abscessus]|nr:Uncharacterised protein [Mycobacteroides abscessus subsp. abscessus]